MKYNFISVTLGSDQPAPLPSPPSPTTDLLGIEGCRQAVVARLVRGGRGCRDLGGVVGWAAHGFLTARHSHMLTRN
jgi:ABC-type microcin C transport system permease subunit YejE